MKIETKRPIIKKKKVSGESIVKMKTEITELLGIEYPIIQGGMAWVAEYHLAAAVSELRIRIPSICSGLWAPQRDRSSVW